MCAAAIPRRLSAGAMRELMQARNAKRSWANASIARLELSRQRVRVSRSTWMTAHHGGTAFFAVATMSIFSMNLALFFSAKGICTNRPARTSVNKSGGPDEESNESTQQILGASARV